MDRPFYAVENVKYGKNIKIGEDSIVGTLSMVTDIIDGRRVSRNGYSEEKNAGIIIGDNVRIGCGTYVNYGWKTPTIIEDNVWIGNKNTLGHDSIVRKNAVIVSGCITGGHSEIGEWTFVAPMCYISPWKKIGKLCYIGPKSNVTKDVPDYSFGYGNPFKVIRRNEWRPT